MPNRELNDPMEKSNEIAHVNAEFIPQDNSADSDDKAVSRRRVLEAGAAALALLMMPKLAFGATCPGGNPPDERGWFGSGNGSVVHHGGNYIGVTSKTWWWQVGYSWDASQWLCLSFRIYVESIFTDELYDIFKIHVQAKCGDVNTANGSRIWFSKYKDNYLHFWVSNLGIAGSCQKNDWEDNRYLAFSNENLGGGRRSWWSITGWSDLGYDSPTYLYKRNNGLQDAYFGLGVYVYNVVCGGVNNWTTPDRVFLSGFTSSPDTFMGSDIHAKIDKITLDQDMSLFGKIVAIVPDSVKSGYQCLDVDAAGQSSGTLVHLYGADGSGTNYTQRNFIMGLGAMDERGGITFTIFPAHVKGFSRVLNASGGRGYLEQAARNRTAPSSTQTLQLYGDDNTIAGRFWVTKSVDKNGRYNIISDASGFAFDQADGKTAEGTIVRLHSDGNNGSEWSNEAHKWRIEEVFFKGTISLDAERVEPGKTISVIDPSKTCTPYDQGGTGSVKYLYRWYWMQDERESPFAENKYPEAFTLSSWCHLAYCGDQIWRDAYAGAGYPVRDTNFFVEAFKLRIKYGNGFIENNADFGAICYAGCMGIENSGDFSWSDVCRDGEELGKGGVSNRITGIKIWLEGDIAKEYDIAYRAFIYGQGWTERFHSNGGSQDDAELCGSDDASGSKGAIKCIQVFAIPKPRGAKLAREFAEDNSFIPENSHSGGYLTAQAMLALNLDDTSGFDGHKMIVDAYQGDSSKGLEALPVPPTPPSPVGIKVFYYVDGETDPCFEEEYEMGTTYQVNPDATAAGQKDNCLDLVCWYTDPEYTQPYESQELATSLKLYGYNPCSVKYDTTSRSSVLDTSYNWSTDADLGTALDLATLYPQDEVVKYGTKLTFAGPWSAWCEDAGKTRCVSSTPGVYANAAASGSPILSATIKGNTTVYVDWPWSGYDGVMSARL